MARRYAMSHNRHGWAIHIRSRHPELSLCGVALKREDFGINRSTDICKNCLRKIAKGK